MSLSTTAYRRKTATYGKASRKPMALTGGGFVEAGGEDTWILGRNLLDRVKDVTPVFADTTLTQNNNAAITHFKATPTSGPSQTLQENEPADIVKKKASKKANYASTASCAAKDIATLAASSSEPDGCLTSSPSSAGIRKRRRISAEAIQESCCLVYDDDSLQRHLAAENQGDFCQKPLPPRKVVGGQRSASPIIERNGKRKAYEERQRQAISSLGYETDGSRSARGAQSWNRSQADTIRTSPPKSRETAASISDVDESPCTPEQNSRAQTPDRGQRLRTPSRPLGNTARSTTPRQRKLWSKLLVEKPLITSPSSLNILRLAISDTSSIRAHHKSVPAEMTQMSTNPPNLGSPAPRHRRMRIIDTLHQREVSLDCESDCVGELSRSNPSDNITKSIEAAGSEVNDAISMQSSLSVDSRGRVEQSEVPTPASVVQPPSSLPLGSKVTYARQRSYLTSNSIDEDAILSTPLVRESVVDEPGKIPSGVRLPNIQLVGNAQDQYSDIQESHSQAIRSIRELREAGGNARLVTEFEAMLDDIEGGQPSSSKTRQMRLLELVVKLQQPSSHRLFMSQGLESRLLSQVDTKMDSIATSLLVAAILRIVAGADSMALIAELTEARILDFLVSLLGLKQALESKAKKTSCNLSKHARKEYSAVCNSMLDSPLWRTGSPPVLSCHALALQCLEHLVRQMREAGSLLEILPAYAMRRIVATSVPSPSQPLSQHTEMTAFNLELAVSILQSCTINNAAQCRDYVTESGTLKRIIGLLPLLNAWEEERCGASLTLTLRLYVNLTNNNPSLCEDFVQPEFIGIMCRMIIAYFGNLSSHTVRSESSVLLSNLILLLGALVNIAESSDMLRQMVMNLHHHEDQSYLAALFELFRSKSQNVAEVSESFDQKGTVLTQIGLF